MTPDAPLFLVRHGQTEYNAGRRLQGHCDSPLTEKGLIHAASVAAFLAGACAHEGQAFAIQSSPLGRAATTARIIRDRVRPDADILFDPRLSEVHCGSWEGLSVAEIAKEWPDCGIEHSVRRAWAFHCPDGETPVQADARLSQWLAERRDAPTIVVMHGIARALLIAAYAGLDQEAMFTLPVGHDMIFRLEAGQVTAMDASTGVTTP